MIDEARLSDLLDRGKIVRLTPVEREEAEALLEVVKIPGSGFVGGPTLVRLGDRLAALERALPDEEWVLRPLADEDDARAFLARRREEHDRMWDGCGCRIDYDS